MRLSSATRRISEGAKKIGSLLEKKIFMQYIYAGFRL